MRGFGDAEYLWRGPILKQRSDFGFGMACQPNSELYCSELDYNDDKPRATALIQISFQTIIIIAESLKASIVGSFNGLSASVVI